MANPIDLLEVMKFHVKVLNKDLTCADDFAAIEAITDTDILEGTNSFELSLLEKFEKDNDFKTFLENDIFKNQTAIDIDFILKIYDLRNNTSLTHDDYTRILSENTTFKSNAKAEIYYQNLALRVTQITDAEILEQVITKLEQYKTVTA